MSTREAQAPFLSAVVISRGDDATIGRAVASVVGQECPEPIEVIVVTSGGGPAARIVRERFPTVTLIALDEPALPGEARNAGLRVACGRYVSFPGSHVELPRGSLGARIRAHQLGYPLVTGTLVNGTRTWAGWASYFLDNRTALPGRPSGELRVAPVRCSYLREALTEIGGFPEDLRTAEDTVVNDQLFARGHRAYRSQEIVLIHNSPCRSAGRLVRHHFTRGRGIARALADVNRRRGRHSWARILAHLLGGAPVRILLITLSVARWGRGLRGYYVLAFPLVVCGAMSWWAGLLYELTRTELRSRRTAGPHGAER